MDVLTEICACYVEHHRDRGREEMQYFRDASDLKEAIRRSALSNLRDGRRHPHQRRIPYLVLSEAETALQQYIEAIEAETTFAGIYDQTRHAISRIPGIGPLTIYDIATRIGDFRGLYPEVVYLHAGAKVGAAHLGIRTKTAKNEQFGPGCAELSAAEIEDALCIYKDFIGGKKPISDIFSRCLSKRRC